MHVTEYNVAVAENAPQANTGICVIGTTVEQHFN